MLVVIAPLFVAFILPPLARRIRLVEALALLGAVLGLGGAGYLASIVLTQQENPFIYQLGGWPAPWGIELVAGSLGVFSCWWWVLVCRFSYLPRVILPPR